MSPVLCYWQNLYRILKSLENALVCIYLTVRLNVKYSIKYTNETGLFNCKAFCLWNQQIFPLITSYKCKTTHTQRPLQMNRKPCTVRSTTVERHEEWFQLHMTEADICSPQALCCQSTSAQTPDADHSQSCECDSDTQKRQNRKLHLIKKNSIKHMGCSTFFKDCYTVLRSSQTRVPLTSVWSLCFCVSLFSEPEAKDCREHSLEPQHTQLQRLQLLQTFNIHYYYNNLLFHLVIIKMWSHLKVIVVIPLSQVNAYQTSCDHSYRNAATVNSEGNLQQKFNF